MLAAVLVPETALLVPGAAGSADVLPELRAAASAAVADLVAVRPERVLVVAARHPSRPSPGAGPSREPGARAHGAGPHGAGLNGADLHDGDVLHLSGPMHPTLAAAGVDDAGLGWVVPVSPGSVPVRDVAPSVALHLLWRAGWQGETHVTVVPADADAARKVGAERVTDRTGLLLLGSLSARRGPDGPLPDDERAPQVDAQVLADLTSLGGPGHTQARQRLAEVPAATATELAVSAWAPWQVLCAAIGDEPRLRAVERWSGAPYGAGYAVVSWLPG